ncbi:MAG: hypothetical protein ABI797_04595 [Chloroflexota bacterium]
MTDGRRAFLVVPLLLAACSGGAGPSAIPTSGATVAPTAVASAAPVSPTPAPQATATTGAPVTGDLVSLMPTEIAGNAMTIEPASDSANSFMILWNDEPIAQDLLFDLGASPSDIEIVFSYPADNTGSNRIYVDAYRVEGADGIALRDGMVENYRAFLEGSTEVSVTQETVSGKETVLLDLPQAPPGQGRYFYAVGDIVFIVQGIPLEWVEDAFSLLP